MEITPNTFTHRGVLMLDSLPDSAPTPCSRTPYGVMPRSLYTDSAVSKSNTGKVALEATTIRIRGARRSAPSTANFAAAAMSLSSVSVVGNAPRLRAA